MDGRGNICDRLKLKERKRRDCFAPLNRTTQIRKDMAVLFGEILLYTFRLENECLQSLSELNIILNIFVTYYSCYNKNIIRFMIIEDVATHFEI